MLNKIKYVEEIMKEYCVHNYAQLIAYIYIYIYIYIHTGSSHHAHGHAYMSMHTYMHVLHAFDLCTYLSCCNDKVSCAFGLFIKLYNCKYILIINAISTYILKYACKYGSTINYKHAWLNKFLLLFEAFDAISHRNNQLGSLTAKNAQSNGTRTVELETMPATGISQQCT